jgi:hypothetical protein
MEDLICRAITERRLLSIYYEGAIYYEGEYRRIEPHVFGKSRRGSVVLRAYQVEGYSDSGEPHFWKMFDLRKIEIVNLLYEHFPGPRPEYNPRDPVITDVICQL